jgi:hypothetical protein
LDKSGHDIKLRIQNVPKRDRRIYPQIVPIATTVSYFLARSKFSLNSSNFMILGDLKTTNNSLKAMLGQYL